MTPHHSLRQPHEQSVELAQSHQPIPTTTTVDDEPPPNRFKHIKDLLTENEEWPRLALPKICPNQKKLK